MNSLVYQRFSPRCSGLVTTNSFNIGYHGEGSFMTLIGHDSAVHSVAYSADGGFVASGSADDTVRIWDTSTGEEAISPLRSGDGAVFSVDVACNMKWVASGTSAGVVCVWNITAGRISNQRLIGHADRVFSVVFSPDSSHLASGSADQTARLWNPETGEQLAVFRGHSSYVEGVTFCPNGSILASISQDDRIRLWDISTGQVTRQLAFDSQKFHVASMSEGVRYAIDISPDGEMIAGNLYAHVSIRQCKTGATITAPRTCPDIRSVRFSPDSQSLVAAYRSEVGIWSLPTASHSDPLVELLGHSEQVNSVTFSPNGLYIASASNDKTIRIWSIGPGQSAPKDIFLGLKWPGWPVWSVAVSPDSSSLISGHEDGSMEMRDACTGKTIPPYLQRHGKSVLSVTFSPDGRLIASASADLSVRLSDARSGKTIGNPMCSHADFVKAVKFSNNGRWLASVSYDNTARLWCVATQQELPTSPFLCQDWVYDISFSHDSGLVAAGDKSGHIYLWRTDTGKQAQKPFRADAVCVHSLAFSPNDTRIVSGGTENAACIWEATTGQLISVLEGHTGTISAVAWSRNGSFIGTGSYDSTVRLWDASKGVPLATLHGHPSRITSVAFTSLSDRLSIVSASYDSTIRKWDVESACRLTSESASNPIAALASAGLEDGWLVGSSGELLLWVPAKYRAHYQTDACTLMIAKTRVFIGVGDSGLHAGLNWTSCCRD